MKKDRQTKCDWQTLPIELMQHFNNSHEWALMQLIWFNANLDGWVINLSKLNADSCIKSRGTLLEVLTRLVARKWIVKLPMGQSGKHNKYVFDKPEFVKWVEKVLNQTSQEVLNKTSESPKQDFAKSETGLPKVLNKTKNGLKQDSTDKEENFSEKLSDNSSDNPPAGDFDSFKSKQAFEAFFRDAGFGSGIHSSTAGVPSSPVGIQPATSGTENSLGGVSRAVGVKARSASGMVSSGWDALNAPKGDISTSRGSEGGLPVSAPEHPRYRSASFYAKCQAHSLGVTRKDFWTLPSDKQTEIENCIAAKFNAPIPSDKFMVAYPSI